MAEEAHFLDSKISAVFSPKPALHQGRRKRWVVLQCRLNFDKL